jgi:hypothetical protein
VAYGVFHMKKSDFIAWPGRRAAIVFVRLFVCFGPLLLATPPNARAEVFTPTPRDVSLGVMVALAMGAGELGAGETAATASEPPAPAVSPGGKKKACPAGYRHTQKTDACRRLARPHAKIERQSANR